MTTPGHPKCIGSYGSNAGIALACSPAAGCGLKGCPWQREHIDVKTGRLVPSRTPEAQADIEAAHAAPCEPGLESTARIHLACMPNLRQIQDDAIVLIGPEADRYRALQAAALAAHEATKVVAATNTALRDAFHAFCAGVVSPSKET